jgi:hypothetical protein
VDRQTLETAWRYRQKHRMAESTAVVHFCIVWEGRERACSLHSVQPVDCEARSAGVTRHWRAGRHRYRRNIRIGTYAGWQSRNGYRSQLSAAVETVLVGFDSVEVEVPESVDEPFEEDVVEDVVDAPEFFDRLSVE